MSKKIFILSFFTVTFALAVAQAEPYRSTYSSDYGTRYNYLSAAFGLLAPGQNMLTGSTASGNVVNTSGFTLSGFFGLGADYDYMLNKDFSIGGVLRYYNISTTINGQAWQNTLFTMGPSARGYLPMGNWLSYVSAGLMYMAPGLTQSGNAYTISSGIGLMLSLGILYQINDTFSLGIETMRLTGLANNINGNLVEDYMFKGRFALGH